MADWQGLLKFTLKYSDGTKPTEFKQMSQEDKKWLEDAMNHYCNSEIERIKQILKELEEMGEKSEESVEDLLENLQELLDSLDKGTTLYKLGGHITLLKIIFYSQHLNSRVIALQIYSSANQNDSYVQNISINTGALEMVELLRKEKDIKMKENLIGAISSTVRGQNLQAKRIFIKLEGLQLLNNLTANKKQSSERLEQKVNILWRDLLFYDDHLHFTYNDLSSFSNTSNLNINDVKEDKKKHDLSYDVNQQFIHQNQKPENAGFKNCVKKFMQSRKELFQGYLKWLQLQIKVENEQ